MLRLGRLRLSCVEGGDTVEKRTREGQEGARLEHCPACGSTEVKNNLYFCKGQPLRVYVQCSRCGEFVARYTLRGYTSDKTYESLLERLRFTRLTSGKRTLHIVEGFGSNIAREYQHVLDLVHTQEDQRRIEEIIEDEYPDSLG
jgi:hypothetical protein